MPAVAYAGKMTAQVKNPLQRSYSGVPSSSTDYRRLLRPPPASFSLFGMRGTGKTTWAGTWFADAHVIDLGDARRCHQLLADPALLARDVRQAPSHLAIVVNDVQRAGPLLGELWRLIATTSRQFVLLGSSVYPLRTSGPQLATHAPALTMFPLVPAELGRDFSLDRVLRFGSLPAIWEAADPRAALDDYAQAYVQEEIRGDAAVRNLPAFLRFLPVAALAHGQVVNVAALARDAATSRTTVDGYLAILRDTLVATLLPAFEPRLRVRERRHPKLYWTDSGVVRAMKGQLGEVSAEERPALIEGLALTVLRAHNHRGEIFDDIGYWSPGQARSTDVDFLLRRGRDYVAIEIDGRTRHGRPHMAGLRAIAGLPHLVRRVLVYLGDRTFRTEEGVDVVPLAEWFDAVATARVWP
jgi:uncharacterized protein